MLILFLVFLVEVEAKLLAFSLNKAQSIYKAWHSTQNIWIMCIISPIYLRLSLKILHLYQQIAIYPCKYRKVGMQVSM